MQAELTRQFPDTLNRVEVGTIMRQKVESIRTLQQFAIEHFVDQELKAALGNKRVDREHQYGVVAIQLLDGVAAGIFGVISIIIAADLMRS